jgi:hypothetical protein
MVVLKQEGIIGGFKYVRINFRKGGYFVNLEDVWSL